MHKYAFAFSLAACALLSPSSSFAFDPTTYSSPANKIGGAIAAGIRENLVSRGFSATDPRVLKTIESVGARVVPLATAAGAGATWIGMVSRLSPWVIGSVVVYEGLKWYFDSQGKVTLQSSATFGAAITVGASVWGVNGNYPWFSTPEEAAGYYQLNNTVFVKVYSITKAGEDLPGGTYRYWVSGLGDRGDNGWTGYGWGALAVLRATATVNCPAGQAQAGAACLPTGLTAGRFVADPSQQGAPGTLQQAYDALTQSAKDSALSAQLLAEVANRLWRDASTQSTYAGVPFSANRPIASSDIEPHRIGNPADWPLTKDLATPVPTSTTPVVSPVKNDNQVKDPAPGTKLDLGPDPGIGLPDIPAPPTDIFKPVKDAMSPWLNFRPPVRSEQCPTWSVAPAVGGKVFSISVQDHCTVLETHRAVISAVFMVVWVVSAALIVLSA